MGLLHPAPFLSSCLFFDLAHCSALQTTGVAPQPPPLVSADFSFCAFPSANDAAHKVVILHYESASEQRNAFHAALMDSILSGGAPSCSCG